MGALLDHGAVLHDENEIRIADRGQPMGDDEARSALHQLVHRLLDVDFRPRIDAARRFIQNENRRVRQNGAGDRQQLLLTLRNVRCFLVEHRVIAFGSVRMKWSAYAAVQPRTISSSVAPLSSIGDIVADRAVKQPRILQHHAEQAAQVAALDSVISDAVNRDAAAIHFVEPHQQVD